jgi:tripartite-type tricarboxylate transporter receptor subunit TctC
LIGCSARVPKTVVAVLERAIHQTMATPKFARASGEFGVHPASIPAVEFDQLIAKAYAELVRQMRLIGIEKKPQ